MDIHQPITCARRPLAIGAGAQLAISLLVGLLLRVSTFGDPNLFIDDSWYLFVGESMHKGAIPYVDLWDRKPLGIFLTYWAFAFFRNGVLAYQIGAWLSASLTAFLIARIAVRWTTPVPALLGGCTYLATAGVLLGFGGQTPMFYNSLVAGAALLVFRFRSESRDWQLYLAMLLLGIALTFKQTVFFEACFFGLLALAHHRSVKKTAISLVLGILPFALIAGWYWSEGYWSQFYYATVVANVGRPDHPIYYKVTAGLTLAVELMPLLLVNLYAFVFCKESFQARTMGLWLLAAALGFLSVPYFTEHYALPALVPLSIVAATAYVALPFGMVLAVGAIVPAIVLSAPYDFERHRRSTAQFERAVDAIKSTKSGERLLVYDGPPLLYAAVGAHPMSPLAFPDQIGSIFEKDMSPIPTVPELRRLIGMRPTAVLMGATPIAPADEAAYYRLVEYVRTQCAPPMKIDLVDPFNFVSPHLLYVKCDRVR